MAVDDAHDIRSPAEQDAVIEAAVLTQLLVLHPVHVTFEELLRSMVVEPKDFARRDAIERAVRDLVAAGLLHRHEDFVFPSHAALRFDELLGG
ncbi:MAG: hypothetical protein WD827_08565 [Solirubrobacterales bacterium]